MYIPPGFSTITPYCFVRDAHAFIRFLCDGLGGEARCTTLRPDGQVQNAQIAVGTAMLMVSEATPRYPPAGGAFYLYVEDAHAAMARALAHGATLEMPVADMPYGDRQGGVRDAHGHIWWITQRLVEAGYEA